MSPRCRDYTQQKHGKKQKPENQRPKTNNNNNNVINVQSLRSKELMLLDYLHSTLLNACILTETWLRDCDKDKIWLQVTNLNKEVYRLSISNCSGRAGGGLALLYRTEANVSKLSEGELETFQFARWRLTIPGVSTTIVALYHPSYSVINPVTNEMFTYGFTNWILLCKAVLTSA